MGLDHARPRLGRGRSGYTLTEIVLVTAIMGVLVAMAIPRMGLMLRKSKERRTRSFLGVVRSALFIYYNTNSATWPSDLNALSIRHELTNENGHILPNIEVNPYHLESHHVNNCSPADSGWYGYSTSYQKKVIICCTHTDTLGTIWSTY